MFIKKSIFLVTTFAMTTLPLIAQANLITVNSTKHEYSAAKVKVVVNGQTKYNCSGDVGEGAFITGPGDTLDLDTGLVKSLCLFQEPCSASIIMNKDRSQAIHCKGTVAMEKATINDLDKDIVKFESAPKAPYKLEGEGTHKITIYNTTDK